MLKVERANLDNVVFKGMATHLFESDYFHVLEWYTPDMPENDHMTSIMCKLLGKEKIMFYGEHNFLSDNDCLDQLTNFEIKMMLAANFEKGKEAKALEIKDYVNNLLRL